MSSTETVLDGIFEYGANRMAKRLITAFVGIAIGVTIVLLHHTMVYPIAVVAITALSIHELLTACKCGFKEFPTHYIFCQIFGAAIPLLTWFDNVGDVWRIFTGCVIVFLMFAGFVADSKKLSFNKLAMMCTISCFVTLSLNCLISIVKMSEIHAISYVVMALAAAWLPDAGGFLIGSALGKHKLCPDISPHKTIEGAIGGIVVNTIVFAIYATIYRFVMQSKGIYFDVNYLLLAGVTIFASVISIFGDLSASLIKREYEIKDFGNIFPGHGGMVDRFDSVFFVLPFMMFIYNAFGSYIFMMNAA